MQYVALYSQAALDCESQLGDVLSGAPAVSSPIILTDRRDFLLTLEYIHLLR
jgi:hypothetical protein